MAPFRRRTGPLRGRIPPPPVSPATRAALRRLAQAHQLLERGEFGEAGAIFADLAQAAESRGIPRAPQLHLQAGRAWLYAGLSDQAVERIRHGLRLMETSGQERRLRAVLPAIADELRSRGMSEEAKSLEVEYAMSISAVPGSREGGPASGEHVRFPPKCPHCGGTIRPSEVDWVGPVAVQCDYCGSTVEGQA